jgi:hypothetical protein
MEKESCPGSTTILFFAQPQPACQGEALSNGVPERLEFSGHSTRLVADDRNLYIIPGTGYMYSIAMFALTLHQINIPGILRRQSAGHSAPSTRAEMAR